jgi:hypothetical protein
MPRGDQSGPIGNGNRDGSGRVNGGRGQRSNKTGRGKKTGGNKGKC